MPKRQRRPSVELWLHHGWFQDQCDPVVSLGLKMSESSSSDSQSPALSVPSHTPSYDCSHSTPTMAKQGTNQRQISPRSRAKRA